MTGRDTTVHYTLERVNILAHVTKQPTSDDLAEIVQSLVQQGVADELAIVASVSPGTVYRHARPKGAENRPGRMDGATFTAFADLFLGLGLLEDQSYVAMRRAADEIRKRAATAEAEAAARETLRAAKDRAIEEQAQNGGRAGSKRAKRK